jgi:hypothetical protein
MFEAQGNSSAGVRGSGLRKRRRVLLPLACFFFVGLVVASCRPRGFELENSNSLARACPSLPKGFSSSDLLGTWIGKYFGNIDRLTLRADGKYRQSYEFYADPSLNFESPWRNWYVEEDHRGYALLHLVGLRRCDGLDSECSNPGGGLPGGDRVINPCTEIFMTYPGGEIVLFVTGSYSQVPRGVMLQQARFTGSDWTYTYRLEE